MFVQQENRSEPLTSCSTQEWVSSLYQVSFLYQRLHFAFYSTSYDRYYEGRKDFANLITHVRNPRGSIFHAPMSDIPSIV